MFLKNREASADSFPTTALPVQVQRVYLTPQCEDPQRGMQGTGKTAEAQDSSHAHFDRGCDKFVPLFMNKVSFIAFFALSGDYE